MATQPPIKTTSKDIEVLANYLRNQVGWTEIDKVRKAVPSQHADNRKIEAMRYVGLLERDAGNVRLSESGREFASKTSQDDRAAIVQRLIRDVPLYANTLEWLHYSSKDAPTKADVANYWHDHQSTEIGNAKGAALTDASVFFLRVAGLAKLGAFVGAGTGRETHLKVDADALREFVEGPKSDTPSKQQDTGSAPAKRRPAQVPSVAPSPAATADVTPALHLNIEIHIAADAEPATVEEIFKNMRKYLIESGPQSG